MSGATPAVTTAEDVEDLRARLQELEDTLDAIRSGHVDALVVSGDGGERVFSLAGAEHAYRVMIEAMNEGAVIVGADGLIRYSNYAFTVLVGTVLQEVLGRPVLDFIGEDSREAVQRLMAAADGRRREIRLTEPEYGSVPVFLSAKRLDADSIYLVAMDLRELRETESELRMAHLRYRTLFDNASEGIFQLAADGHYLGANPALARMYGYATPAALLAAFNGDANAPYLAPGRRGELHAMLRERSVVVAFESQVRKADGSALWVSENLHAVHDPAGALQFYEGNVVDISARRHYEAQLEQHANYDPLTGLANRRLLQRRLGEAIAAAEQGGHQLGVAYLDLDNFKTINDALGHDIGDRLLLIVGQRLRHGLRAEDMVARQGGDEFVLLFDFSDAAEIPQLVARLLKTVAEPLRIDEHELDVTCSVGFSVFPTDGRDAETLLKNADAAMYLAKEHGRNNVQAFTEELNREIGRKLSMESALRRAFRNGELDLCFQPQAAMADDRIVGAEALLRWGYGRPDERSPAEFVPLAEETGLIVPIGEWALYEACRQCRQWLERAGGDLRVAVNLSPRQFRDKGLSRMVARVLAETGLPARHLDLELTESLVMHNIEGAILTMQELREMGVRISIDDFGVGYSSLSYLRRLPINVLKIDRSFVHDITDSDERTTAIAGTIMSLGHSLGLRVVAEGVENTEQQRYLRRLGCDEYQGFLLSPAVRPELFAERFLGRIVAARAGRAA